MTSEQLEAYTLHLRIEEISQKLRINDVVPNEGDRYVLCPSLLTQLTVPDRLLLHLSMTTSVVVSIQENSAIANVSKMNDTS